MLKINQKKKRPYTASIKGKPKVEEKPTIVRPEWNDSTADSNKYKLSQAELVSYNYFLISLDPKENLLDFKAQIRGKGTLAEAPRKIAKGDS